MDGIGRRGIENDGLTVGVGYIVIPINVDRDTYVKRCLSRGRVMVVDDNGAYHNDIPIDNMSINLIKFPEDEYSLGSGVLWVKIPVWNKFIIVSVLNKQDEVNDISENQLKLRRFSGSNFSQLNLDGKSGNLSLNTSNIFNVSAKSSSIRIKGDQDINVDGDINTKASKYKFGDAEQQAVLGNVLHDLLDTFIDAYDSHTHATALGTSSSPIIPQKELLQDKLDELLSEYFYLD